MSNSSKHSFELSPEKLALLNLLLEEEGVNVASTPTISRRKDHNSVPLSFAQERLWFLDQLEPGTTAYNLPIGLRLRGLLNVAALQQSLSEIIRRHETLRTTFAVVEGQPVQVISPFQSLILPIVNLRDLPQPDRQTQAQQIATEDAHQSFNLAQGPLLRSKLLQLSEDEYILCLMMHHIVSDGWSMGVLIKELATLYEAFANGKPSPLAELPIQYADFAVWQKQWLQGEVLENQLAYWKQQLAGVPTLLALPSDRPRSPIQTSRGATYSFLLPSSLSKALKALSQREGGTLFMTLLAAFETLLYRYTGQEDILVGSVIANRNRAEIEPLIGFFINTLSLRADLSGNPTFREMLSRVSEVTLGAYAHQDLPLEKIIEELQPERNLSYTPLFQVMFILQNALVPTLELPGLTLSYLEFDNGTAKFDLSLDMTETEQGLMGELQYNTDLFDSATINRMMEHFQTMLTGIVANPNQRLSDLPILGVAEQQQLLVEWNDTFVNYPLNVCIHQLFEVQVEKTPDAVAVVFEDKHLTYRELNYCANQLAHYLQALGIEPDVLVGLCVERSLEMVVGLLGILKAGGAYLPLDPAYPQERLAFMLSDSEVSVLLTQERLMAALPEHRARVVCLDTDWKVISQESEENFVSRVKPENLVYVIYTSGSTSRPKGVMVSHSTLVNAYLAWEDTYQLRSLSISHLQMASFSFDVFSGDLVRALCSGAKLVLCPREWLLESEKLYKLMLIEKIDSAEFVPVVLRNLVQYLEKTEQDLNFMRLLVVGSDSWYVKEYEEFQRFCGPDTRFINSYGVSEATIDSAYFESTKVNLAVDGLVPIGRPFANTQIYLLDRYLQPVPIGVPGELHIGGAGLARGYLNRPDLTKEKFIPNPFSDQPGSRLYKTGDLARYLPDGNIEFIGRIDNQVKIRGFRIELSEIEAVLGQHPDVLQTVVIVWEDQPGNKRLVAYVVPNHKHTPTTSELQSFLKKKLPEYMVPSAFVTLETLPLTPNGKIDRKALPKPDGEITREHEYISPRTPNEEIIANIFALVLGVQNVGIHDNFFTLGGHSLLATQLISRLRLAFTIEIPIRAVFESPTVAQLDQTITQLRTQERGLSLPPIQPIEGDTELLPLSWTQQRLWFLNQLEGSSATYNIPAAVRITGNLDINALQQALSEIVRRHEILRTSIQTVNGTPRQVIHPPATMNINVVDLQQLSVTERETVQNQQAQLEAITPFNLENAPLIRCSVLHFSATEYVLLLTMHHIVSDGWSMGVFMQELSPLYQAFCAGVPSPLPELPIQYADFAVWQRQWLSGEILDTQLNYWKTKLAGANQVLELPTDYPRPPVKTNRAATQSLIIPKSLGASLAELSRQEGVTLFITLLAAFGTLLHRYTGEEDVSIGSPIAGRNQAESEKLIGFFINTLVLRIDLSGHPSFRSLLDRVRQMALDAYAHQDIPFEKLVEELQLERDINRNPLFQVWFNMLNLEDVQLELPGLSFEIMSIQQSAAKFDLSLYVREQKQEIQLDLVYDADVFAPERMMVLLEQYHHLLIQIVANPQASITDLSLVTTKAKLLLPNPQQPLHPQSEQAVHLSFCQQAQRVPQQLAVVDAHVAWSYAELEEHANQLAHYLLAHNIHSQQIVAIYPHRSAALVWAILGVLKAGCAFMILDPAYPAARLIDCLAIAQPRAWLNVAQMELPDAVCEYLDLSCIDRLEFSPDLILPTNDPKVVVEPDHLAYIAFTSGSTGKPKGIKGTHKPLSHFLQWHVETFGLSESDRFSMLSGLAHDPLLRDIFTPLSLGATLCIPRQEDIDTSGVLADWIQQQHVSVAHLTPAMAQLLTTNTKSNTTYLRYVFFSGDVLTQQDVTRIRNFAPQSICVNFYGATETPQAMGHFIIPDHCDHIFKQTTPVGRGIADVQLLVLNANLHLAGISELGEIYVRTPYLAQGYIGSAQLTLEKFIINPLTNIAEDQLYKTGDLGRYLPDGNIEFLGRIDNQVKIRGFRIELGEIEVVLNTHPQIQQAVVIAKEDIPGNKRLIAYVVPCDESLTTNQLREFLRQQLPEYMVPSAFVTLETLPLTPNGKIDRKALPNPDGEITREHEYIAPRTPNEEIIANIFALVLGVQNVGIHDNFFTLGGHSLLATQLISRLRLAFTIEIPLRAVFESPTVAQLEQTITQLRTQERGLTLPPIQPTQGDTELLPLSWAQERLWFLNQLEGSSATYNMPAAVGMTGNLDINALQQALSEIVHRHSILRTSFQTVNGTPTQVIHPQATMNIKMVDLQQLLAQERETVQNQLAHREAITPFNLENAPLIRCSVLQLSATEYVLLLSMHHIVSDGWSMGVFIQELSTLYQAFCAGVPSPLPELPIQYADFAVWQRQWLSGLVLETQLNYWRNQLHGAPSLLQLPTDRPRPVVQTYQGRTHSLTLNLDLTQKLQSRSRASGTTLFMTLLAAFATLLYRYSGQSDILVGTPIANRNRSEVESLIGFFVNTLVLRTRFEDHPSFESLLAHVRETTLKAYEHQDAPFEQVVEALQPQRSLAHSPLFGVMFILQNAPMGEVELPGVTLTQLDQESTIAKFDLTVSMSETAQGLVGSWEYNTDLFDGSTIERMAGHFQNLLSAIVENPVAGVGELPLLNEAERHQLLVEWNATESEYPQDKCIHQLFESQVQKTPQSVAVVFSNQQLTYLELNQRANQLAHHLQTLGVGPEVLVGICVERSIEMLVGLLGILKAGGAYVPLDPNYPQERLSYMLADSGVEVLLTHSELLSSLPSHTASVVCLDTDWGTIEQHTQENLDAGVCSDNLAYVIYTSGSTGLPKGVAIEHHSLCNLAIAQRNLFDVQPTSRVLQFASISFDASVSEIFMAVTTGAMLVLGTASGLMPGDDLKQILHQERVTHVTLPPSALAVLPTAELPALGQIIVAGEACPLELVNQWSVGRRFFNAYGPTESTVCCTSAQINHGSEKITIGRPISNTTIYILDSHLQPVPIGVAGELYIGGDGLARGYLNRPELTNEKFIPNPFSDAKSERLYKTGDLARYQANGNIEFLGRIDNQVKIRGFRIELGEIEAVLNTHPQIQQAVVIAKEDIPANKRLIAYVSTSHKSLTINQLREFLRQQLPEYMVPSAFVTLETLPLTPNGKIDREALPKPDGEITREHEYISPRTPNEEIIANIFALVLGVQNVGIHDNFFTLGGHSLLATQLISRLRLAFTIEIPLRAVFESPTVAQLEQTITQLRTQERGLTLPPIQPTQGDTELLPLSWAQERLWFLNQLEGSSATYNMPAAVGMTGNLDINALQQALSEIVHRHSILRTSFQTVNGTPTQVIHPQATMNIKMVDLQHLLAQERETVQNQLAHREAITPFNLENAPLIRCSVLQLSATEYVLLLSMHHIVSDGWSMGVFIQELSTLYQAFCAGVPSPLPELPLQYVDFAVWQRQWLSGLVLETQLNYWRNQLHGAPSLLQLPTDRPRPVVQTYQGRTHSLTLNLDLTQKLQSRSRASGTTLFMTLLAAFATLLYRYSGQSDILVGTPIANRNRSEVESLIGFFVNTLVLRTRFEDHPSFESLLAHVRETTLKAYEHQDAPFEQVVEALQPQRSLAHSPLFGVMFILQNAPMGEVELPGVTLTQLDQESTIAKFDLTVSMSETAQGLVGSWEYNTDLFDGSTIERMAGHFQNLLSAIVENPVAGVGELPLLNEAERHQLLVEWNATESEYPQDKCIHQLFESQVQKTPQSVAVVFSNQQLTYLELNQRANQLAHHLQTLGVGPEVLVGICVERSIEMLVGLLGILKAGGAYVPLDPNYPQERLSYMLADSGVEVLLTHSELLSSLPSHTASVVCLDTDWGTIEQHTQENLDAGVCSDNLAYVIYTSGSTGLPKGVAIEHHSLCNLAIAQRNLFDVQPTSRVLQFASISFDASVSEIFMAVTTGAMLVLGTASGLMPGDDLKQILHQERVTHVTLPPSALAVLPTAELPALGQIIVAGEACPLELVNQWSVGRRFFNAYGPTESTVCCTSAQINHGSEKITIGRPISNTTIYILDSHLQPVPIGVAGELYIGGDGLARGYLNRPELTNEKFIPNPFSDAKSERLYKTGDLARYQANGNIEFLGRIDNQVKIRGFRIELGEIEAVLNTHPQIQQAVVIAKEDIPANKRLIAYVSTSHKSLTINQLREFLRQQLPEYMVPSAFVTLETLPLTPNGKIDREALPKPDGEITREHEYISPRTPNEEIIANIFALVLGVQNVGIHDNFFTLGGHSLLATQLISRLRLAFTIEIPLRAVFESPTVAQLEQTITQLRTQERGLTLPPIQPTQGDTELLPLSWAQERLWFLNQLEGSSATYNMPAAVGMTGNLDINALQQALSEIVHRHSILRTSFQTVNGTPTQVIHPQATMNIKMVDLQQLLAQERETVQNQLAHREAITPFNLENAPLIRCSVLQLSATEYVLLLSMHHIVSDGWSMGVFIQELSTLYQAFCAGVPSPLPELPIQYADFAVWQRQWLSGLVLETQLNYWRNQLHGAPSLLQLPTDRPRPVVQTYQGRTHSLTLNLDLTQKLQSRSRASGTTLFMTLLAAFATLLYRYSGQSDILVGTPIANRNRSEVESLIGFFVNTLVLRTRFEDHPSFESLLAHVRETTLKAYEHQDAPFEQVVEALQPQRSLAHSPLFGVMFILQNAPMGEVELPGVTLTQLDQESTIAKFDLTVSMSETAQGLVGSWEYNTDLFDGSTIERMAGHFQNLLSAIVENPVAGVGELPLLNEAERHQLLVEWNDTASVYPKDKCIHQLFEEQVEKTPHSVAVVFENQRLTYLELNQRANQLAHHLQSLGVGPEVLVGICVQRSVEMVVGLLGILKAGGAYVPLDPTYPQERLSYMLADSGVEVLLTHGKLLESLPQNQARVVCLDTDWKVIEQYSQENFDAGVGEDNLVYVIYTSGSTGVPKGVLVAHKGLLNLVFWHQATFGITSSDIATQLAGTAFDASAWELWPYLSAGASIHLLHTETIVQPQVLQDWLRSQKITITFVPTPLLESLFSLEWPHSIALRIVLTGGDKLHQYPSTSLPFRVINNYGPTENTVVTTSNLILATEQTNLLPPIGRPISNTQIYILDSHLQPVPIGAPGELYIGGDGLARGYLNRPELTREKFIPNPFSNSKSERLYKTGDLARYLIDGNIEFLGRIDNQVKIRGFRIELGEIEAVLSTHPQIQQAVVIAKEDIPGNKRLVAYVVPRDETLTTNQLREFLRQQLPEYMVPSAFVTLETLPLTPNGKIDREALPKPDGEITREHEYIAPRTPNEEIIANIFALVLGVQNVGIHDNFFTLGGHSLLATQLISRLRLAFTIEIPLRAVFESPTVAQLEQTITQLRTQERGLTLPPIQPTQGDTELLPLSWAQERLWFLNQLEGSSATYNMPAAVGMTGNLDINALQQALSEIVHRHSILRTSFQTVNGTPTQVIHPQATMNIKMVDLQHLLAQERETVQNQLAHREAITPFNLENAPLIRCSVLQLSATEYVLLLSMHHIVSDGWSMGVFIQELSTLYQAFCAGVPSPLPELPLQYVDFAVWQRQWLSGLVLETQLNYWRNQLHGAPSLLQLPTDRPRPVVQTYQGRTHSLTLNLDLTQKLQSLSRASGTTLFMTLLAAFATLLYRYSGQSDILIGSAIANRNRSEVESLIGFFVNTLVLRTRFEDHPSFESLLAHVRETTLKAYEHQDAPFEQVVEALQPQRSLSHSPLFGVMFILQNAPMGEVELPGVTLTQLDQESTIAKFDLTVSMSETAQGLVGAWEYNTDLFDGSTIERMAGHFQNLLSAIVENPVAGVGELPLLNEAERHQLLVEWNDTASVYPKDKCIHQLFEEQVEKTPHSVAVVFENQRLTYLELNQRANQLAHHLQSLGVGPEVLVGICVQRSVEMVVGLLGILKAGGAYVPLDPTYPQERLSYMLADSGVEVLLTHGKLLESLPQNQARVVCLDTDWGAIEQHNKDNLDAGVGEDNLAYVIYTSGSTGVPKGVAIVHHSPVALCHWAKQTFTISQLSGVLAATSICFDLSVFELFVTLCVGGKVIVAQNALHIPSLNTAEEITLVNTVPSAIAELLRIGGIPPQVKTVNLAGEPLQNQIVERLYQHQNIVQVYNLYGPTEDTTYSTFALVEKGTTKPPSIGRPISNTQIYILDEYLQPLPIGVPGELYIGGDGLARGYLNRPELTREKFIPNPFSDLKSERLYKTGDLARHLIDGNIEYLGRIDNQVKIRGFRIELGEIEAVLNTHPQIQQAVVIAKEDIPGNKRLIAYVSTSHKSLTINQLREFLFSKVPEYMVPSAFVTLDTLPLTPNGKVDRRNLPAPEQIRPDLENVFVAPRTPTEEMLASIWAAILGLERVGADDNFFELGGHSLLATQVISRVKQTFKVELPLRSLFEAPTLAGLAESIEIASQALPVLSASQNRSILPQQSGSRSQSPLVSIQPAGSKRPFFCVHPGGGNVLCYVDLARYLGLDQPLYGLQAPGLDGEQEPYTQIKDMAVHYIKALRIVQPEGPYLLGGWSMGGIVAFEMATQLQAQGQKVELLALFDASAMACSAKPTTEDDENVAILGSFARELGLSLEKLNFSLEQFLLLEPDEQLTYVFEQAKMSNQLSPDIEFTQVRRLFHVFKTNVRAMWSYIPQTYLGQVTLFKASEQLVEAHPNSTTMGWDKLVTKGVEIHMVPGNHYTMFGKPHIESLAKHLNSCLNQVQTSVIY